MVYLNKDPYSTSKIFAATVHSALVVLLLCVALSLVVMEGQWDHERLAFYPTNLLATAPMITLCKVVLVILTALCVALHRPIISDNPRLSLEYSILILLVTLASLVLLSAQDLSLIFLAMELQTLSLVAFSYIGHGSPQAVMVEAVLRYFFNTSYASVSFLFGLSLLYAVTGSLHLDTIPLFLTLLCPVHTVYYPLIFLSMVLLFYPIFFKLTLAPFHQWVGDLYQGTSGYVGSYFTLVTKIPMLVVVYKLLLTFSVVWVAAFFWWIAIVGLISVAIGNIYAFHQPNFRRFWAVASISHMGQILLAFSCFTPESTLVAFLYLFSYLTANIFFWAVLLHVSASPKLDLGYREFFQQIFRFVSLYDRRIAWLLLFIVASIAGVPPTFGFVGKFYLFLQLYATANYLVLAILFFLNLISLANYIRLLRLLFFETPRFEGKALNAFPRTLYFLLSLVFLLHVFFGLWSLVLVINFFISLFYV